MSASYAKLFKFSNNMLYNIKKCGLRDETHISYTLINNPIPTIRNFYYEYPHKSPKYRKPLI